ncbi:MAG: hypothetical protein WBB45_20460 [Cyclobacteriaceae bacterium]
MSIENKLITFAQQELVLARTDNERDKIKTSLDHLESILRKRLSGEIREFRRFGSWTRNTLLPRRYDERSDVDLLVVFKDNGYTPQTYRSWIHDVIENSYPNSISKKDNPTVRLELNHIVFELTPAIHKYNNTYHIPQTNQHWQSTTINDINDELKRKNQQSNGCLRNVIRLCKYWNASHAYPLKSYEMEKTIVNNYNSYFNNTLNEFINAMRNILPYGSPYRPIVDDIANQYSDHVQLQKLSQLLPGLN